MSAQRNEQFGDKAYWDQRYADPNEPDFDWFQSYDNLKEILSRLIPSFQSRILVLGCGNSQLSPLLYSAGYQEMVNIDYSSQLIGNMQRRYPEQTWYEIDILELSLPHNLEILGGLESFDIAIDKGTLDALMAEGNGSSPWNPDPRVVAHVHTMLRGVDGLLKPGAKLIYITFGQPHFRRNLLDAIPGWSTEFFTLGEAFHYFVYVCTKQSVPPQSSTSSTC